MKADPVAQRRLLDLQAIDTALLQLAHKKQTLPVLADIAAVRKERAGLGERYVAAETRASDAELALEQAEKDLAPVRDRRTRNQQRVDSGQIGDAKALQSMIDEIAHLTKRIGDLEDLELEAMEESEQANAARDELKTQVDGIDAKLAGLAAQYKEQAAELDADAKQQTTRRDAVVALLPEDLLAQYQRIAAKSGGVGAAALHNGRRCSGCGIEANTADVVRYAAAAPDEVLRCEECGRILVRAAE